MTFKRLVKDSLARLMQYLCNRIESIYNAKKALIEDRTEEFCSLMILGDCIEMLLAASSSSMKMSTSTFCWLYCCVTSRMPLRSKRNYE